MGSYEGIRQVVEAGYSRMAQEGSSGELCLPDEKRVQVASIILKARKR